jgi:hypothetical protein
MGAAQNTNNVALTSRELRLVVAVIGRIGDQLSMSVPGETADILIPDTHGILKPASDLVFNDSAWSPPAQYVRCPSP